MPIADYIHGLAAGFLQDPGLRLLRGWTEAMDAAGERARLSARASMLELVEDDGLNAHGRQSRLERLRSELAASYRSWLRTRWTRYRDADCYHELLIELARLGYTNADAITWLDLVMGGGNPAQIFGGQSSFYYVTIKPPHPFKVPRRWDEPGHDWDGGSRWDIEGLEEDFQDLIRTVKRWRPAAMSPRYIEIVLELDLWGNPASWARIPVWEDWEYDADGQAKDNYNGGYL